MEREDILIYVDNIRGNDVHDGIHQPVKTADRAFSLLPPYWHGRAEIIFAVTDIEYPVTASAVYLGTPIGPAASPLVIRGGYRDGFTVEATVESTGDRIVTTTDTSGADDLVGRVLMRDPRLGGGETEEATSIRGNGNSTIFPQRTIASPARQFFTVQWPAVTLEPRETLNLVSHDGRSLNLTLIGISIAPAVGKGLNLLNLRAQCDTCEFFFRRDPASDTDPATFFVHTNSRIQGGIGDVNLSPGLDGRRMQAGVFIHSDNVANAVWAARGGVLGGHLTFRRIAVRASQGGWLIPKSLEANESPIQIMAGGAALAEPQKEGRVVVGGWGTASNKARIRNVEGDGLRVLNGGSMNSPGAPVHLDVNGCSRDGIVLDSGATASFGPTGGNAGLVTTDRKNVRFGMNVRNGSFALVGRDAASASVSPTTLAMPLTGNGGDVALDDQVAVSSDGRRGWAAVDADNPPPSGRLSLLRRNT